MSEVEKLVEAKYGRSDRLTDLEGQKIGKLLVLSFAGYSKAKYGFAHWNCICDCGTELTRSNPYLLRKLKEHSCGGCNNKSKDLTGQKFGRLLVLKKAVDGNYSTVRWLCQCDCGNTVERTNNGLIGVGVQKAKNPLCCGCSKFDDITGQRFAKLVAIKRVENDKPGADWLFQCDCGKTTISKQARVKRGMTKSCGCLHFSNNGLSKTKLKNNWSGMINRCHSPNVRNYKDYGGRGIYVCDEWRYDFLVFYDWAITNGWHPDLQLDRIDNDGPYAPWNCRYVTHEENANNTRRTPKYDVFGESLTKTQIGRKYGVSVGSIAKFLWDHSIEDSIKLAVEEKNAKTKK